MTTRRSLIAIAMVRAIPIATAEAAVLAAPIRKEKIAIIGTGRVGSGCGKHWIAAGHTVTFGSRTPTPEKASELARAVGAKVAIASNHDAAQAADIILLAVPYRVMRETLAGLGDLAGKILIDPSNPPTAPVNGFPLLANPSLSASEEIQAWTPGTKVVKALNHVNYLVIANPEMGRGPVTITMAGDDVEAKARVGALIAQIGLEPLDIGALVGARHIEALAKIFSAYRMNNPDKTFEIYLRVRPNDLGELPLRQTR